MTHSIQTVAIYARVSTQDQDCQRQLRDLRAYAEKCGYQVIGEFTEKASGLKTDREQRKKVMQLAQKRQIDAILVTELTRWGRSTVDLLNTLQELNIKNVGLITQSGMAFDLSTPQGKMISGVLASLAEFERDLISERTRSGLANAKARGKQLGRQTGDDVRCRRIRSRVIELKNQGLSIRAIARAVQASTTTVQKVLRATKSDQTAA